MTDTGTTRTVADVSKVSEAYVYITYVHMYCVLLAISFWESSSEADIKYYIKNDIKTTNYIRFIFVGKNVISLPLSLVGASFCAFHCGAW